MTSIVSVMNRSVVEQGTAIGLGVANIAYFAGILTGIVVSWIAILAKRDFSLVLIALAILFTVVVISLGIGEFLLPR